MNILHVLSSNFYAGSVAYAIAIAELQSAKQHRVYFVTDNDFPDHSFESIQLPIANRSYKQRYKNIKFLRRFIKEHNINIVHCHSRAASWVSYYAIKGTNAVLVSTMHGVQPRHSGISKMDIFGSKILVVCKNLREYLIKELHFDAEKMILLHNGFDNSELAKYANPPTKDNNSFVISCIGRFNGPKGRNFSDLIIYSFPTLLERNSNLHIQLVGPEWDAMPIEGREAFNTLKQKFNDRINYLGFQSNVFEVIQNSDLIIGAGRVAIEGLMLNKPVLAMGEASCHWILDSNNINEAIASNFGDMGVVHRDYKIDAETFSNHIQYFLENPIPNDDFSNYLAEYDIKKVEEKIYEVYFEALKTKFPQKHIPILMYHKITDTDINSPHSTFVSKDNFSKHLRLFKLRGMTSITFDEYLKFIHGEIHFDHFPKKPFIITFDDGYSSVAENALPLMQKFGFKGVAFIMADTQLKENNWDKDDIGSHQKLMDKKQIQQLINAGWEIGAHTFSHPDLTKLIKDDLIHEISGSKSAIENDFGCKIVSFAYPFGNYKEETKAIVEESNYSFGIATDSGAMRIEDDRFAIFRVNILPKESIFSLFKKSSHWYRDYYKKKRRK